MITASSCPSWRTSDHLPYFLAHRSAGSAVLCPIVDNAGAHGARHRTVLGSVLFVLGFAAVFTSYGALFGAFGALLIAHQETLVRVLGVLTILLGLVSPGGCGRSRADQRAAVR